MKVLNKNQSSVLNLNESILLLRNKIYIYIIDFVKKNKKYYLRYGMYSKCQQSFCTKILHYIFHIKP